MAVAGARAATLDWGVQRDRVGSGVAFVEVEEGGRRGEEQLVGAAAERPQRPGVQLDEVGVVTDAQGGGREAERRPPARSDRVEQLGGGEAAAPPC